MMHTVAIILLCVIGCSILGALIGLACRGRLVLELTFALIVTAGIFIGFGWKDDLSRVKWSSFENAYEAIITITGPFLYFFFVPAGLAAFLVGRWQRSRKTKPNA